MPRLDETSASRPRGRHWFPWQGWRSARRRGGVEPTDRDQQEMAALSEGYDEFKQALVEDEKARAYLAQRALPLDVAQLLGGAYVPWSSEIAPEFNRFADHLIFPYTPQGFLGRTLRGWKPRTHGLRNEISSSKGTRRKPPLILHQNNDRGRHQ